MKDGVSLPTLQKPKDSLREYYKQLYANELDTLHKNREIPRKIQTKNLVEFTSEAI